MTDQDWDLLYDVHVHGAFKVTKAAWEIFQKQKYGRIVMTASAAGLYGNYGQTNYGSAKMALVGFGQTLAREGAKKNIFCNIFAPVAGSRITETVLPPELIEKLKPEYVAPFIGFLCHESCPENGSIYEIGAGFAAKVRWERAPGALLKVDDATFTPSAIAACMQKATSFNNPQYPQSMADVDWLGLLKKSKTLPPNKETAAPLRFDGRVILVTGAGGGLGRGYALLFGKFGAKVVVNDLGRGAEGRMLADLVVDQIKAAGGEATANYDSVESGEKIISEIIKKYGRIDVIVNNAGILRDKSFSKMTEQEWNLVLAVHVRGSYKVTKAAWPHMLKQKYGRVINTASAVGLYGNFGQANYSAAKAALIGFSTSLAAEGVKSNVLVNVIAPNAGTAMTATILPQEVVDMLKPEYVAPLVGYLGQESNQITGGIFEVGSGWFAKVRWQQSGGYRLDTKGQVSIEDVASNWRRFNDFSGKVGYPKSAQESFSSIVALLQNDPSSETKAESSFNYTKRDIMLYNLGVGCTEKELKYVYEGASDFAAIPTFGVIPAFVIMMNTKMDDYVNGYNPTMLLHGEHYLELKEMIPIEGKVKSERKILQVLPKGKGCVVVIQIKTYTESGKLLTINEGTIFLRGANPKKTLDLQSERCPLALESPLIPDRKADSILTQKIPDNQAAIYRLSGDYNPLHVDSSFAQMGGFPKPILHGLCSYGHAAQHVLKAFANDDPKMFKAIKARFTKHVFPGETVQTEMWKISPTKIAFQLRVLERNEIAIGNAFVELYDISTMKKTDPKQGSTAAKSKAAVLFTKWEMLYATLPAAMKEDQVKKVNGIFQFEIKGPDGVKTYFIDLKSPPGKIGTGPINRPDITIIVKDEDFAELAEGKISGQQAFMKGKVQVRGNMMLAMKLDRVLATLSSNVKSKQ
jgi:multifunctional beta-oxidation protein